MLKCKGMGQARSGGEKSPSADMYFRNGGMVKKPAPKPAKFGKAQPYKNGGKAKGC